MERWSKNKSFSEELRMLLFWNHTYYNAIAGNNGTQFVFDQGKFASNYATNVVFGLLFIFSTVTGNLFNPFIILFNWSKKTIISALFVLTAGKLQFNLST